MITYNWEKILKYTKRDIDKILMYFSNCYVLKGAMYNFISNNKWAESIYTDKEEKNSYLLNIDDFIINPLKGAKEEQFMYLELASRRDLFTHYNTKGKVYHIPLWKVTDYDVNLLKTNRLLLIDDININFIYEGEE